MTTDPPRKIDSPYRVFCFTCLLWLGGFASYTDAALLLQDYDSARHDRFANSPSFVGSDYNWSGVGLRDTSAPGSGGSWATMISPSYFLSAAHAAPEESSTLTFYASNNPNGSSFSYQVAGGGQRIGTSDLWLGKLTSAVDSSIATYPLLTPDGLVGSEIYVFGKSNDINPTTNARLGRNEVDSIVSDFSHPDLGSAEGNVFAFDFDNPGGVGADEARISGGDSGAPSFVIVDGQPAIAGIHWFRYVDNSGEHGSADTLVGSYHDEIGLAMPGETFLTVSAVPEPSIPAMLMLAWALTAATLSGHRSRTTCD